MKPDGSKTPIDLYAVVQERLARLTFITGLQLKEISDPTLSALGEGTSESYSQGVRLNDSVGIFLDHWGWMKPHSRYSLAVFERVGGQWQKVRSRIEGPDGGVDEALSIAIRTLAEHALRAARSA